MTDRRSGEKRLHELEFNDLNIHLYLTLNYETASEHLDLDFMVLYNVFCAFVGLNNNIEYYTHNIGFGSVSSLRYPIRRKWPDRSRYRSWVSDRCIPNIYILYIYIYIYRQTCQPVRILRSGHAFWPQSNAGTICHFKLRKNLVTSLCTHSLLKSSNSNERGLRSIRALGSFPI